VNPKKIIKNYSPNVIAEVLTEHMLNHSGIEFNANRKFGTVTRMSVDYLHGHIVNFRLEVDVDFKVPN